MHNIALVSGICVYCSDPRDDLWKEAKKQLIPSSERFVPLGVLGGPICLANSEDLPMEYNFLLAQIHFARMTFPRVKKLLVIGHDCGYYEQIKNKTFSLNDKIQDLVKAAQLLEERFSDLTVTAFFKDTEAPGFTKML